VALSDSEGVLKIAKGDLEDGTHAQPDPEVSAFLRTLEGHAQRHIIKSGWISKPNHMRNGCICVLLWGFQIQESNICLKHIRLYRLI